MSGEEDNPITQRTMASGGPQLDGDRRACLVVIHGEGLGRRVDVGETTVRVGRSRDNDLVIAHPSVSRRHCEIRIEAGVCHLRDLGATNRTRVNDVPVEGAELRDGDHVTVGESLLKFIGRENPESSYHAEVYQLVTHDPLTELPNRRHFTERVDAAIAAAVEQGEPLSLCIVDVDLFKPINDGYGHVAGDGVLQELAARLRQHAGDQELPARIGGEEFALLMPGCTLPEALVRGEALRREVEALPFRIEQKPHRITVSVGVADLRLGRSDRSSLMRAADAALYAAKSSGRNCVRSPEPDTPTENIDD
ncbi:GGDEF domain-containing protein [Pseudomarimonas salicorniae]|uniref:diguanylate cyclase n=1 Tax=Pseudomarimonas salicorniae TaxID=2933270 RepID=A0ABT0GNM6_9GAMM|nr:GGDEF domain-containing protein [Lysobacter sp. CAU 1642]MCK7595590.1 GGDEF domain-containing protein [Lysobacter sp. CAU 1642]